MSSGPLSGITIVSLEQAVAAPYATRQLADLGARVIKIERPGEGDFARHYDETVLGESSYFVWLNRSKESITLDVKTKVGVQVVHRLLEHADFFVQNLGPGAVARLGLDAKSLERYPRLVVCDVSGYGDVGPWSDRKAYDMLVQCETGLLSLTGTPESPSRVGISIADIAAGMYAYSGILAALYRRETTGRVSNVKVSLLEALAEWMGSPAYYTQYGGSQPLRVGAEHATIAPYGPYDTADGTTVMIAIQSQREWRAFATDVLGDDSLVDDPRFDRNSARVANRTELNAEINKLFGLLSIDEAQARLDRAKIANARLRNVAEFVEHPSMRARPLANRRFARRPDRRPAPARRPIGRNSRMDPIPTLGEHTDEILREFGFAADAIEHMHAKNIV